VRVIGDEVTAAQPVLHLPSATGAGEDVTKAGPILFMIPGVEGMGSILEPLARNLKYQVLCLQLGYSNVGDTAQDMAQALLPVQHICSQLHLCSSFISSNSIMKVIPWSVDSYAPSQESSCYCEPKHSSPSRQKST
jgi:hypothetical protein